MMKSINIISLLLLLTTTTHSVVKVTRAQVAEEDSEYRRAAETMLMFVPNDNLLQVTASSECILSFNEAGSLSSLILTDVDTITGFESFGNNTVEVQDLYDTEETVVVDNTDENLIGNAAIIGWSKGEERALELEGTKKGKGLEGKGILSSSLSLSSSSSSSSNKNKNNKSPSQFVTSISKITFDHNTKNLRYDLHQDSSQEEKNIIALSKISEKNLNKRSSRGKITEVKLKQCTLFTEYQAPEELLDCPPGLCYVWYFFSCLKC